MLKYLFSVLCCLIIFISLAISLTNSAKVKVDAGSAAFFVGLNQYRRNLGLPQIYENERLNAAAKAKVEEIFATGRFEHTNPVSRFPLEKSYSFSLLGELLANNFFDESSVLGGWQGSPSHNALMINPKFCEGGYYLETREVNGIKTSYGALFLGVSSTGCESIIPQEIKTSVVTQVIPTTVVSTSENTVVISSASSNTTTSTNIQTSSSVSVPVTTTATSIVSTPISISSTNSKSTSVEISFTSNSRYVLNISQNTLSVTTKPELQNSPKVEKSKNEDSITSNNINEDTSSSNSEDLSMNEVSDNPSLSTENIYLNNSIDSVFNGIQEEISEQTRSVLEMESIPTFKSKEIENSSNKNLGNQNNNKELSSEVSLSYIKRDPILVNNMVGYYYKDGANKEVSFVGLPKYSYLGSFEINAVRNESNVNRELYIIIGLLLIVTLIAFAIISYWKKRLELI